jgi:hypothetical protein
MNKLTSIQKENIQELIWKYTGKAMFFTMFVLSASFALGFLKYNLNFISNHFIYFILPTIIAMVVSLIYVNVKIKKDIENLIKIN